MRATQRRSCSACSWARRPSACPPCRRPAPSPAPKPTGGGPSSPAPAAGRPGCWPPATNSGCPPPPDKQATRAEIDELKALAAGRDAAALAAVAYWDAGAPGYRWNELRLRPGPASPNGRNRGCWPCSTSPSTTRRSPPGTPSTPTTGRARPSSTPRWRRPCRRRPAPPTRPSTPSRPAPPRPCWPTSSRTRPARSPTWPRRPRRSRLLAGTDYPSDVAAGLALGRRVGALVDRAGQGRRLRRAVDRHRPDRAGPVDRDQPGRAAGRHLEDLGADLGRPVPARPAAGLRLGADGGGAGRAEGPLPRAPTVGTKRRPAGACRRRTTAQAAAWAPLECWPAELGQKLFEYRLDANPPRAARAYALVQHRRLRRDGGVLGRQVRLLGGRPVQLDPTVTPVFPTPAHPSYPSAHSAIVGAPLDGAGRRSSRATRRCFARNAEEMAASRLWAGIHSRATTRPGWRSAARSRQAVLERAPPPTGDQRRRTAAWAAVLRPLMAYPRQSSLDPGGIR